LQSVAEGKSIVVRTGPDGKVDPQGSSWSIFEREDPALANRDLVPFAASVPGSPEGEVRYTEAVQVKAKVSGAIDPRTGAGVAEAQPNPLEDPVIGSRVDIRGPGGTNYTLYGVYQNGVRSWTTVDPFSADNRGNEGRDADGSYVIAYAIPGGAVPGAKQKPYSPKLFIDPTAAKRNVNGVDSSDGTPWDPENDKETGFGSPMGALANASTDTMLFLVSLGPTAVARAETEWYAQPQNQTPEMKALIAQGADPRAVIEGEANKLFNQVKQYQQYGYTPEDQQRNRTREGQGLFARAAAEKGMTVEQARGELERGSIAGQLEKWGLGQRGIPTSPGSLFRSDVRAGTAGTSVPEWQKQGWSVGDLLNQPGMSTAQANDLAFRISKGAVGKQGQATPLVGPPATAPPSVFDPRDLPPASTPFQNPYVSPTGGVPQRAGQQYTGASPFAPVKPVVPKPVDTPKPPVTAGIAFTGIPTQVAAKPGNKSAGYGLGYKVK
jgi:hypothetical protein